MISRFALALTLFTLVPCLCMAEESKKDTFSSGTLVDEVVAQSEDKHLYDWRNYETEYEFSYGYMDESNNFENEVYQLGLGMPSVSGSYMRMGLRRVNVYPTPSSNLLGRTPFTQAAGRTRYEVYARYDMSILEGRSFTRLSPWISDLGHAMFFTAGLHYRHANKGWVPKKGDPPDRLPGQKAVDGLFGVELGFRWQIFLPEQFGIVFDAAHVRRTFASVDLSYWTYFSGGITWAP
ncbi:MAG: hypothetical protein AB7T49_13255 [Oligoflexales bacterium]